MTTKRREPKHMFCIFPFFCFFFSFIAQHTIVPNMAYPLSTTSRWIVDENGERVKLACANWPSHLQPVVAEGLSKQPVDAIVKKIVEMGFNCVRLTWPLDLMNNETLANNVTVRQSFQSLGLNDDIVGFQSNNPSIIDLSLIQAFKMVVTTLGNNDVMVILDNHLTHPGWCCSNNDGNGFFGDRFFDPDQWLAALSKMAATFDGVSNVVGMSLRNELRGPKQNVNDWFKYMQQGAEAVHKANKNVLVILSGLSFDTDLSFVRSRSVNLSFTGKLVFEMHWYSFSDGGWKDNNPNDYCGRILNRVGNNGGFLLNKGFPLFLSEFGIDERGGNVNDNRYFGCLTGWAAENDLDWSLWALTGSYYLREGKVGLIEYYGALDSDWISVRNSSVLQQISILQSPLQGPGSDQTDAYNLVFHPLTGLCLVRSLNDKTMLTLGSCNSSEPWSYTKRTLRIKDQTLCLQSNGPKNRVTMTRTSCSSPGSIWQTISASRMHLASTTSNKTSLCLDVDATNNVVANACKCLSKDSSCEPVSQWFKIIKATRSLKSSRLHKQVSSFEKLSQKSDLF